MEDQDTDNRSTQEEDTGVESQKSSSIWTTIRWALIYLMLYLGGIGAFLIIIAEPFTMQTYFSDNSLLPGLANREFSLVTEAEYYHKILTKLTSTTTSDSTTSSGSEDATSQYNSLANLPAVMKFISHEMDNFGLEVYEQNFSYMSGDKQFNGTNMYSIIRGERSTSSEAITLCAPFRKTSKTNTLPSVALTLAVAKYFSTKNYWAKDVIILFVDRDSYGLSAWLDSYHDIGFRQNLKGVHQHGKHGLHYDSLTERSGPMQAAIVLELTGRQFSRVNIKIQGMYGQLPNLDLFNLVIELSHRENVTPYFHDKTLPYGMRSQMELYKSHFETAMSFVKTQATMEADGLHGLFLRYAIQSLTLEGPKYQKSNEDMLLVSMLSIGRLVEGVFRSLNNLTERFNRSYYFYIIVSLRRFTSIGYYMAAMGLLIAPLLLKAHNIQRSAKKDTLFIGARGCILLFAALVLSVLSTFNISTALILAVALVPVLLII